jgi:hypothetical protein
VFDGRSATRAVSELMANFKATADDLDEIVRLRVGQSVREQMTYPLGALAAAAVSWPWVPGLSLVALGAGLAWASSTYSFIRQLRSAYLWRYAWLQEDVSIVVREEGLECSTARGTGFIRWSDNIKLRALHTCFVLEDEGEDVVVIPKKYLDTGELLALNARVARN